mmetsp:Transcript_17394/g.52965  ORF Transcript_17394/g.52965 Transcript_17394/m.52965 type:complete len:307 (-) Transcript_17394:1738-2658(-)
MMREARSVLRMGSTLSTTRVSVIDLSKAWVATTTTWSSASANVRAPLRESASSKSKALLFSRARSSVLRLVVLSSAMIECLRFRFQTSPVLTVVGRSCESVSSALKFASSFFGIVVRSRHSTASNSSSATGCSRCCCCCSSCGCCCCCCGAGAGGGCIPPPPPGAPPAARLIGAILGVGIAAMLTAALSRALKPPFFIFTELPMPRALPNVAMLFCTPRRLSPKNPSSPPSSSPSAESSQQRSASDTMSFSYLRWRASSLVFLRSWSRAAWMTERIAATWALTASIFACLSASGGPSYESMSVGIW